jgi:phage terminase small subunit|tara:strand:- start:4911 stop:5516 length:606 start_codon:yes stop_codon:yes gene_type:complete
MGLPKKLTDIQRKFSELYVYNEGRKTPYECAVEAGYAEDSARVRASELRNPKRYPLVVKYIGELREEVQQKYEVTFEKHIKELARLREEALKKGSFSSAVNAEVSRGKAAGLYIEQKIIKTGKLEDLTEQELEQRMKEIMEQYSPILDAKPLELLKEEVKAHTTKAKNKLPETTYEEKPNVEDSEESHQGDHNNSVDKITH